MHLPGKATVLALGAAGLLALGVAGAAVAQDGSPPRRPADAARDHRPPQRHHRPFVHTVGLYEIVEASGLDSEVFRAGWAEGTSINDVLVENGLDPRAIHDAVLADLEAVLDRKVADGVIDPARADEILANASEHLAEFMSTVPGGGGGPWPFPGFLGARSIVYSAAETIGITSQELLAEIRETEGSIASVAVAHGVDVQLVIDNAVARVIAKLDEAVANGRITEERADAIKATLVERVTTFVNEFPGGWHER